MTKLEPFKVTGQFGIFPLVNFSMFYQRGRAESGLWRSKPPLSHQKMGQKLTNDGDTLWVSLGHPGHSITAGGSWATMLRPGGVSSPSEFGSPARVVWN